MASQTRKPQMTVQDAVLQQIWYSFANVFGIGAVCFVIAGFARDLVIAGIITAVFAGLCAGVCWWLGFGLGPARPSRPREDQTSSSSQ